MYQTPTATILESQIDYLTCAVHSAKGLRKWDRWARKLAQAEETQTDRVQAFHVGPYQGWHCGRIFYGVREAAALVQLSGDLANVHFDTLMPDVDTVSRIDIAVTCRLALSDRKPGTRHYNEALLWYRSHPQAARPSYHGDGDGGYTCYIGSRTSDRYFRCYDKGAESKAEGDTDQRYLDCWRYELQISNAAAKAIAKELFAHSPEERAELISSWVYDYCYKHGLRPVFYPKQNVALTPGLRRRSDRESRLNWLDKTVKPVVQWLIEAGAEVDMMAALGLVNPNPRVVLPEPRGDEDESTRECQTDSNA